MISCTIIIVVWFFSAKRHKNAAPKKNEVLDTTESCDKKPMLKPRPQQVQSQQEVVTRSWLSDLACCGPRPRPATEESRYQVPVSEETQFINDAPDLAWTTKEEETQVEELLSMLTDNEKLLLEAQPPDVKHPLFMTRLLRGHGGVENAATACKKMLQFRKENAERIRRARSRFPQDIEVFERKYNPEGAPYGHVGLRCGEAANTGLPGSLISLRHFSASGWHAWPLEDCLEYFFTALEQYCVVVHNQSLKQRRMVKMDELRDGCGLSPSALLGNPVTSFQRVRHIALLASQYPELIHKFVVFNASPSWVKFLEWVKSIAKRWFKKWFADSYNEHAYQKDDAKLRMIRIGDWEDLADYMNAKAILSWADDVADASETAVAGCIATRATWLEKNSSCSWSCSTSDKIPLEALFFPEAGGVERVSTGTAKGIYVASVAGCFLLTADNTASWRANAHAELQITCVEPR